MPRLDEHKIGVPFKREVRDTAAKLELLKEEVTSQKADNVKEQGDLTKLKTSDKTNIVGAINELFTNANNGKTLISNVVGSPLLATDTFQQQSNKIQGLKNTLASKLNAKEQGSSGSESLNSLVSKVGNINTGKKFAIGEFYNYGNVVVNNLTFRPSILIGDTPQYFFAYAYVDDEGEIFYMNKSFRNSAGGPAQITDITMADNGFTITRGLSTSTNYKWIAIE